MVVVSEIEGLLVCIYVFVGVHADRIGSSCRELSIGRKSEKKWMDVGGLCCSQSRDGWKSSQ